MKKISKIIINIVWAIFNPQKIERLKNRSVSLDELPTSYFEADNNGQIIYANQAALKEFGYETTKSLTIFDFIHHDELEEVKQIFQEIKEGRPPELGARRLLTRANGTNFPGILFLSSLAVNKKLKKIKGVIINHTEQEKLENKLKEINEKKDKMFSIVAHDLRSPFNSILGLSDVLCDDLSEMSTDEVQKIARTIKEAAKTTHEFLENLLEWARLQMNTTKIDTMKLDLQKEVNNIISLYGAQAQKKGVVLKNNIFQTKVLADTSMLQTILRNLIANAIKFTNPGGEVKIMALPNNKMVEVMVIDNGIGITPENQKKLFQIGEDISTPGTAEESGTGLGLLICKDMVEKQGGTIRVETKPKEGSKFIFTLPLAN